MFRDLDVPLTMRGFLGMVNYTYMWFRPGGRSSAAEVSQAFSDIFLHGILAEPCLPDGSSRAAEKPRPAAIARRTRPQSAAKRTAANAVGDKKRGRNPTRA